MTWNLLSALGFCCGVYQPSLENSGNKVMRPIGEQGALLWHPISSLCLSLPLSISGKYFSLLGHWSLIL